MVEKVCFVEGKKTVNKIKRGRSVDVVSCMEVCLVYGMSWSYVVKCFVGVSSSSSSQRSWKTIEVRKSLGPVRGSIQLSSPPSLQTSKAFPVSDNICPVLRNNNQHGLTWTAFNIFTAGHYPNQQQHNTNTSQCRPSPRWTRTCAICACQGTPHRQPTRREHG